MISLASAAWIVGFLAFTLPAAAPSATQYRHPISFYVLMTFVGLVCFYYWGRFYHDLAVAKKKEKAEQQQQQEEKQAEEKPPEQPHQGDVEVGAAVVAEAEVAPTLSAGSNAGSDEPKERSATSQYEEDKFKTTTTRKPKTERYYFLDNVKSFVTVIVVLHHLTIVFLGTLDGWVLTVGYLPTAYSKAWMKGFLWPNQGYFMPLFFFISAYFVPRSFERKGRVVFIKERAQRIMVGSILVIFVLMPLSVLLAVSVIGQQETYHYLPNNPGTAWFLWWLLLFNLWYAFTQAEKEPPTLPFLKYFETIPGFACRWLAGILVCGIIQWVVNVYIFQSTGPVGSASFAGMPMDVGGLVCDMLFFYVGLLAGRNKWFAPGKKPIRDQLGMNVWLFRLVVAVEYTLIFLTPWINDLWPYLGNVAISQQAQGLISYIFYGLWCVDFSLATLEFFQTNVDFLNAFTKWMADGAYGAYLVQNITITIAAAIFWATYNGVPPLQPVLKGWSIGNATPIPLPTLATAQFYSYLVWVPLTWVIAWIVKKCPGFRHVL